jgi:lipopolysaccharide export system permease protein
MIFHRYVRALIYSRMAIVLSGFLALFALFEVVAEVKNIGQGSYGVGEAFRFIGLRIPSIAYELFPVCGLIGSLWALSSLASNSEFTVFRASGLRPIQALSSVTVVALPLVLFCAALSEFIIPLSDSMAAQVKVSAIGGVEEGRLRSGYWLRDNLSGQSGAIRERMINVRSATADQRLNDIVLYEFDANRRLLRVVRAQSAQFQLTMTKNGKDVSVWELRDVRILNLTPEGDVRSTLAPLLRISMGVSSSALGALLRRPEQMSAQNLFGYATYLRASGQDPKRFEMALWKKIYYPFSIWIMLTLSLPAAYLLTRGKPIGPRIFIGVLLGVTFHLTNSLFSHLGILNAWPAPLVAVIPSGLALLLALAMLARVQRG